MTGRYKVKLLASPMHLAEDHGVDGGAAWARFRSVHRSAKRIAGWAAVWRDPSTGRPMLFHHVAEPCDMEVVHALLAEVADQLLVLYDAAAGLAP